MEHNTCERSKKEGQTNGNIHSRANTNNKVFSTANERMKEEGKQRNIVTFVEVYQKLKRKRALKIITKTDSDIYKISFQGDTLRKWVHNKRRVGRPRQN